MTIEQFYKTYPQQTMKINGKDFRYRYHKNENAKATLVLLTGGIGLSDLFYNHFGRFAQDFSVITFDYLMEYSTMGGLADAACELFRKLDVKVWLVGQSLGGAAAQIFTKRNPDRIEGLVLSNTCPIVSRGGAGEYFEEMKKRQTKSRRLIRFIPWGIAKKVMMKAIDKKVEKLPPEGREEFAELAQVMFTMLTKNYELHMIDMLLDCGNYFDMKKEDFVQLRDRVLLILSDDDETFSDDCRKELTELMTEPTVINDMGGGHLGALMQIEEYAKTVTDYISERS
ncbi:MAG: alpha/beta hydrolase [Oscillospiraceae bacterium]|nr:alpha/beta hydrolase [Oscillospiraceae bacterium]